VVVVAGAVTAQRVSRGGWIAERSRLGAVLAPMAGFSDAPFRRLARHFGAAWAVSEMVSAAGLALGRQDARGLQISAPYRDEPFVVIQLFAADPDLAARAVARIDRTFAPSAIDLNMGCPVKKVLNRGCGSELLDDPERAAAIVAAMRAATSLPVTAKLRLGVDRVVAVEVAQTLVAAGVDALAVHGRTAVQRYDGRADWDAIAEVAASVPVPVMGSGDVRDAATYAQAQRAGLGVMVARAAIGRPWLFAELSGHEPPERAAITTTVWRHARDHVAWYGGPAPLRSLRGQLAAYAVALAASAGSPIDGSSLRAALVRVESLADLRAALSSGVGIDPVRAHEPLSDGWQALAAAPLTVSHREPQVD